MHFLISPYRYIEIYKNKTECVGFLNYSLRNIMKLDAEQKQHMNASNVNNEQ